MVINNKINKNFNKTEREILSLKNTDHKDLKFSKPKQNDNNLKFTVCK